VSHLGKAAWYSEGCAALFCTAPSSGDGWSVATTDVAGRRGRSRGDCNDKFGGTSAAAPFVAGGLALILEANPNMSKATVEWALAVSCRKIDPDHPGWSMNSYGFWHNPRYGFGVIDVEEAIGVVQRWMKSGRSFGTRSECVLHPSSDWRLVVPEDACPGMNLIERVQLVITARATRRGDMSFDLVHESGGMVSTFEGRSEDATGRGYVDWSFSSVRHWGERLVPGDVWGLRARSVSGRDTPIVTKWYLRIVGIGPFSPRYDN
jgi:kexin